MVTRTIQEGRQYQGVNERIAYSITTTPWGTTPSAVDYKAYDLTNSSTDVTTTVFPTGTSSIVGDVITLPLLRALTARHVYKITIKFTSGGNIFECYFEVEAQP